MPASCGLEVRQHAALAEHDGEVRRLVALERLAVDEALEIDVHEVARAAPRARRGRSLARCLRRISSVRVDVGVGDLGVRARRPLRADDVARAAPRDRPRRWRCTRTCGAPSRGLHRLEARVAGDAVVLARAPRRRRTSAPSRSALPGAPGSRTGARPSSAAPCRAGSPASSRCARASSAACRSPPRSAAIGTETVRLRSSGLGVFRTACCI